MIARLLLGLLAGVAAQPFAPWFSERGVDVSIARSTAGAPWIRGVAELAVPAESVRDVLVDFGSYRELFAPVVTKAAVLDTTPDGVRIHFVWDYPFPFRDRDAVVAYRSETLPGGEFRLSWHDDHRPGDPREGVRIERVSGETRIEPIGPDRCRVIYSYLGELGGRFPRMLAEKAWRHEPLGYVLALRRRLGQPIPPK